MTPESRQSRNLLLGWSAVVLGVAAGELLLLTGAYDLDAFSFPATWWRDHPFDFENIRHTIQNFSPASHLWAYDPLHLFGWVPNAFYNPLATAAAGIFCWTFGATAGAYRFWLLSILFASSLAFLPLLPRRRSIGAWVIGALSAALLSLMVFPMDAGILDANPVQVLYTGQWAQRLGVALGLFGIERFYRALQATGADGRLALRRSLVAAMLLGASLFCHFMSGYAAASVMVFLSVYHLVARKLLDGKFALRSMIWLPVSFAACALLFIDFFWILFSVNHTHHHLPLLGWQVPDGALATVREVLLPALPVMLIPGVRRLIAGDRSRAGLSRSLYPLLVYVLVLAGSASSSIFLLVLLAVISLAAVRLEGECRPRHWLPPAAWFVTLLACGPDSLQLFGLDLSGLIPFSGSLGWAKLAAFARFLFIAWLGVLIAEGLAPSPAARLKVARPVVLVLILAGLGLPLVLSLPAPDRSGAQQFFGWMNDTDRQETQTLLARMQAVAKKTPANGYLLTEDTLHHPQGSALFGKALPNGHLPYLVGSLTNRPVLGGAVTTRLTTHPYAHTSRGQLVCIDHQGDFPATARALDRLRSLGVSDVLAHSPGLIAALGRYPAAIEIDRRAGLTHFALEHYRPILTDPEGLHLDGARIEWLPDGVGLQLPPGTKAARLRLVHYPFLDCRSPDEQKPVECRLSAWTEGPEEIAGCLVNDDTPLETETPWIQLELDPPPAGPVKLRISSRPSAGPPLVMLLFWLAAIGWLIWLRRPKDSHAGSQKEDQAASQRLSA